LQGEYDHIFSLGAMCQVAYQLKRCGLRRAAGPFDWLVCDSLMAVARIFENGFSEFMPRQRLKVTGRHETYLKVMDRESGFTSVHDFAAIDNPEQNLKSYDDFENKMRRRWERIESAMQDPAARILFVRAFGEVRDVHCENYLRHEFATLMQILRKRVRGEFQLLAVSIPPDDKVKYEIGSWELPGLQLATLRDNPGRWEGHDEDWALLLREVRLKNENR
jgi:hypothetical protein